MPTRATAQSVRVATACDHFEKQFSAIPGAVVERNDGAFDSLWGHQRFDGCQVGFQVSDTTAGADPRTTAAALHPDSSVYAGWRRVPRIVADGPGSGVFGVMRGPVVCVVHWAQPAFVDDDGEVVDSETLEVLVQCRENTE
jgi:hypothetical protein